MSDAHIGPSIGVPHAAAGSDREYRNLVVKQCLRDAGRRRALNESLSGSITDTVYAMSLARTILEPQVLDAGGVLPSPAVAVVGQAYRVWLKTEQEKVVHKNAYRDSVDEEEVTTVRRSFRFVPAGKSVPTIDPFIISNGAKFPVVGLNGSAYDLVSRAEQRMAVCIAQDETRIALRCVSWAAENVGRKVGVIRAPGFMQAIERAADLSWSIGARPAVLCSTKMFARVMARRWIPEDRMDLVPPRDGVMAFPIRTPGGVVMLYPHDGLPDDRLFVCPVGRALGVLGIAKQPDVASNDKRDKFLVGWTCAEEIGLALSNPSLIVTIRDGVGGVLDSAYDAFLRLVGRGR